MCLMVVACEETQREVQTQGNNLSEHQIQNILFSIFDRIENSLNQNRTTTEDKNGNNVYIIKSVTFNINLHTNGNEKITQEKNVNSSSNITRHNSEILERMAKLEVIAAALQHNQRSTDDQINVLNSNVSDIASNTKKLPETVPENRIETCKSANASGIYKLTKLNQSVYCETTTFGGGWMVFQQRVRTRNRFEFSFYRDWVQYQAGFGTAGKDSEFWLGLEALHQITSSGEFELAVEMTNSDGEYGYARYSKFHVAGNDDKYRLTVGRYSGTVGDQLSQQNKMQFTTMDSDNDNWSDGNCAQDLYNGGWWYNKCVDESALNYSSGPYWNDFTNTASHSYGTYIRMMIRHK